MNEIILKIILLSGMLRQKGLFQLVQMCERLLVQACSPAPDHFFIVVTLEPGVLH